MNALILGATKGLGKEITNECLQNGWNTIEVGSSIQDSKSEKQTFLHCNLLSEDSVSQLISKLQEMPSIDAFFWVSGRILKGEFSNQTTEEINQVIDVNFKHAIPIVQYVWSQMCKSPNPVKIIAIASASGTKARPDEAVYVATKFAQVGFMRSLGLENKNTNLKICLALPGGMQTQFWDRTPVGNYNEFLDPSKVAKKIISHVYSQQDSYSEIEIPRGSL